MTRASALVQLAYQPPEKEGRAAVWVSRDPSCPQAGTSALARLTPFQGWYGQERLAAGQYLCAQVEDGDAPAQLVWWTEGTGAP